MKIIQLIKSAFYQLRSQRLLTWVSISGTALAIFLIMIVVMLQQVKTAPFAPESNRDRILHYKMTSVQIGNQGSYNGPLSYEFIKECIEPLESAETFTLFSFMNESKIISDFGGKSISADVRRTDHRFWKVFDFTFINGKPFSEDDFNTASATAVISESMANSLFGTTDVAGRELTINGKPYRVSGVVKDVSQLASTAYAQVWCNVSREGLSSRFKYWGELSAVILAKSPENREEVRSELLRRIEELNKIYKAEDMEVILHQRPYTQEVDALNTSCNEDPDLEKARRTRYMVYLILLIVPAINLLSMTQSRLRQRMSEIAIRRAFGRQRGFIILDILFENLLLTLIAGIIGLVLSVAFAYVFDSYVFAQRSFYAIETSASFKELFHWSTFGLALLFCFVLNVLSNSIPAWKASRTNLTGALSGREK